MNINLNIKTSILLPLLYHPQLFQPQKSFEEIDNTCPWLMGHLVKINNGLE
jgi:hypothetical protein